jgi:hypothetical protein
MHRTYEIWGLYSCGETLLHTASSKREAKAWLSGYTRYGDGGYTDFEIRQANP